MILLPADTTALKASVNTHTIQTELQREFINQQEYEVIRLLRRESSANSHLWELLPTSTKCPLFTLPVEFTPKLKFGMANQEGIKDLCIDVRPFARVDNRGNTIINNIVEYNFHNDVAMLTRHWVDSSFYPINNNCIDLILKVWVRWMGQVINSRLNIQDTVQPQVNIILAYYMYQMVQPEELVTDEINLPKISRTLSKATYTSPMHVQETIENMEPMKNLGDLIERLKTHSGTDRFTKLTPGFLFSLVQYGWYGASAPVITSVSLEYPPVFVAMIFNSLWQDGYKKTPLGKIVRDLDRHSTDHLVKTIEGMIYR